MYIGLYVKFTLFLLDCNESWIFSTNFRKNTNLSYFMKVRTVGVDLFSIQTDRHDEANIRVSQFYELAWRRTRSVPCKYMWEEIQICKYDTKQELKSSYTCTSVQHNGMWVLTAQLHSFLKFFTIRRWVVSYKLPAALTLGKYSR